MVEKLRKIVTDKEATLVEKKNVYQGKMVNGEWLPTSLHDRYGNIVRVVKVERDADNELITPVAKVDTEFVFVGGNRHRAVYVKEDSLARWLDAAAGDSNWAAASMLRPGKLTKENKEFGWTGYEESSLDTGLLAIMSREDWTVFVQAFGLPVEAKLAQVTVFDLDNMVSAKGTIRVAFSGEHPTVFPSSWKRFGELRTEFSAVLTVDAVYRPQASINAQELQYWCYSRGRKLADWVWEELAQAQEAVLQEKGSVWTPYGYLSALGMSGALKSVTYDLVDGQRGSLTNMLRRVKFSARRGLRAKTTATAIIKEGEVLLPEEAKRHVRVGQTVVVGRNPALPSQDWQVYKVAGFIPANVVAFNPNDRGWTAELGGDHDGDDCVVYYQSPVVGGEPVGQHGLDLQSIKPQARKLDSNTVEARLQRWKNETAANIGQFEINARRLSTKGHLTTERAKLFTTAIQTVIALKKRVAKLEEQAWYPAVDELMDAASRLRGKNDADRIKRFAAGEVEQRFDNPTTAALAEQLRGSLALVTTRHRYNDSEEMRALFGANAEAPSIVKNMLEEYYSLQTAKAEAKLMGADVHHLNQRLKVLVHLEGPEVMMTLDEEAWKQASKWLIANAPTEVWVYWSHPEVIREFLTFVGATKIRIVGPVEEIKLEVGEVVEVDQSGLRELVIDEQEFVVAEETGYLEAGRYQVVAVSKRGATLEKTK
jgi:hypothetical protein